MFLFPIYWIAATSFKSSAEIFTMPPTWAPQRLNFVNYVQVFQGNEVRALWNSLAVASASTLAAMLIGTLAAYSMVRFNTGGRALPLAIIGLRMVPAIVVAFPLFLVFAAIRWVDRYHTLTPAVHRVPAALCYLGHARLHR